MIKKLLSTASAALAVTLAISAQAGSISFTPTTLDAVTFTEQPGNSLEVSSALGFNGNATYIPDPPGTSDAGNVQFGPMDFFTGPESAGVFTPIPPATETFNYQSVSGPDQLMSLITWTEPDSNAPLGEPRLEGTAFIESSSGNADFLTDFPAMGTIGIFANLNGLSCDLDNLSMGKCSMSVESVMVEGGDTTPGVPPRPPPPLIQTPEPMSSVMGLAIALFCLWGQLPPDTAGMRSLHVLGPS